MPNNIVRGLYCKHCATVRPRHVPLNDWVRLAVGFTVDGSLQVWCLRHQQEVAIMTLEGFKAMTEELPKPPTRQ